LAEHKPALRMYAALARPIVEAVGDTEDSVPEALMAAARLHADRVTGMPRRLDWIRSKNREDGEPSDEASDLVDKASAAVVRAQTLSDDVRKAADDLQAARREQSMLPRQSPVAT
jgi:hypothetical protein